MKPGSESQSAPTRAPERALTEMDKAPAANAAFHQPIMFGKRPVECIELDLLARFLKQNSYFDGDGLEKAWNELVAFYMAHRAPATSAGELCERDMLDMAVNAGLWPNTIHHWMPALRRYTDAVMASRTAAVGAASLPGDWQLVMDEVARAIRKFPTWPTDPLHAVAVLGEEFGELTKAVLQTTYEPHKVQEGELRTEAIQTAAMSLRFLASLSSYEFTRSAQHEQHRPPAKGTAVQEGGAA